MGDPLFIKKYKAINGNPKAQKMATTTPKFERYINYHIQKEMPREREKTMFSNEF